MKELDDLKKSWHEAKENKNQPVLDQHTLQNLVKARSDGQRNISMKYFWAAFTLHLMLYSFSAHVIIRYWNDWQVVMLAFVWVLLHIPFTSMLMQKFKKMAVLKMEKHMPSTLSMHAYLQQQYSLLREFYNFKKRYEIILVPLSALILIWIIFRLYVAGGITTYPIAAAVLYVVAMAGSIWAIKNENKKRFEQPLSQLKGLLEEMEK